MAQAERKRSGREKEEREMEQRIETAEELRTGTGTMDDPFYDITVEFTGRDGNAFAMVGRVRRALRAYGVPAAEIEKFAEDALSADYNHVIQTCMKWVNVE